ncbi:uncharacterized protein [Amphiura filiformis]|uniref:uncharacterized protein n=1 Tax=Amphiura filiformis TaxID=82378 RepID=UPI003B22369C
MAAISAVISFRLFVFAAAGDEECNTTAAPTTIQPTTPQPTTTQPATTQPATTQYNVTTAAQTQPTTMQPATMQPATTSSVTTQYNDGSMNTLIIVSAASVGGVVLLIILVVVLVRFGKRSNASKSDVAPPVYYTTHIPAISDSRNQDIPDANSEEGNANTGYLRPINPDIALGGSLGINAHESDTALPVHYITRVSSIPDSTYEAIPNANNEEGNDNTGYMSIDPANTAEGSSDNYQGLYAVVE